MGGLKLRSTLWGDCFDFIPPTSIFSLPSPHFLTLPTPSFDFCDVDAFPTDPLCTATGANMSSKAAPIMGNTGVDNNQLLSMNQDKAKEVGETRVGVRSEATRVGARGSKATRFGAGSKRRSAANTPGDSLASLVAGGRGEDL